MRVLKNVFIVLALLIGLFIAMGILLAGIALAWIIARVVLILVFVVVCLYIIFKTKP